MRKYFALPIQWKSVLLTLFILSRLPNLIGDRLCIFFHMLLVRFVSLDAVKETNNHVCNFYWDSYLRLFQTLFPQIHKLWRCLAPVSGKPPKLWPVVAVT